MVVGIGGFRDLGDPNDPRRRMGGVPQQANIAGLPPGDREIARTVGDKLVYYSPQEGLSIEAAPRGRRFDEGKRAQNERAIKAEIDKMRMEEAIASKDPAVAQQYFSEVYGKGTLDQKLTTRAAELAYAMPEIGPMGALKIAAAEFQAGPPTTRRNPGAVDRMIGQQLAEKVAEMGEIRPELALINQIESEKRGRGTTDAGVADISVSDERLLSALAKTDVSRLKPAEQAALVFALDERGQAAVRAAQQEPEQFGQLTAAQNAEVNAVSGLNRGKGQGKGGRNPHNREPVEAKVDAGYRVPVVLAPASEARKGGKKQGFKYLRDDQGDFVYQPATMKTGDVDPSTGYNQKQYDTRNMLVAMLDPSVELDPSLGYVFNREAIRAGDDQDRTGRNMNVPTGERQAYYGVGQGETGEYVPGFPAGSDPASVRIGETMTLGEAVQDIYMRNRTPIRTYRIGEDVIENISETTGRPYYTMRDTGEYVSALKNQPPGYAEKGLVEVRYGGRGEITDAGLQELNDLIAAVVGPELNLSPDARVFPKEPINKRGDILYGPAKSEADYVVAVNQRLNDPTVNRMQNALLDQYVSPELFKRGRGMQDPDARPVYDLISALSAGRALPPQDIETPVVAEIVRKGDTSDVNDVISGLRKATGANPEVQRLRKEYRDIAGANPKNYLAYAEAFGGNEPKSAEMARIRRRFRDAPAVSSQADVNAIMGGAPDTAADMAVDLATRRQVAQLAQTAQDNAQSNDSPLNAPSNPVNFAKTKIEQVKQALRNRLG